MIILGLVGGVASGKSSVALDFQKLGGCILDGDRLGHEALNLDEVNKALVERWGDRILADTGELNRSAIAEIVFGESSEAKDALTFLESVTHPQIERRLNERLEQLRQMDRFPLVVLDAAIMFKAGWNSMCDQIVFVDAPRELRLKRAKLRGLTEEQFNARESAQLSVDEKKKRANIVIDNSGPPQNTFSQVEEVWHSLLQTA